MRRFSGNILLVLLSLMLVIGLVGCQSTAEIAEQTPPAEIAESTGEPEVSVEAESAPVVRDYDVAGYNLRAIITEGKTVLEYPDFIIDSDVHEFFAVENEKYGLGDLGVVYMIENPGTVALGYPKTYSEDIVVAELDMLVDDLRAYVGAPVEEVPEVISSEYEIAGYTLSTEVSVGETVLEYPAFILDDEVIEFFAVENEKYGLGDLGVVYSLEGDGVAVLTYPEEYSVDTVQSELENLVADLAAYVGAPLVEVTEPEPVAVEEPEPVVVEEVVLPEPPVIKNYGIYGYILHTKVGDGEVVLEYPAFIPDEDVIGFFAVENEKYGLGDLGVVYTLEGDGRAVLTYPDTYSRDVVSAELDLLVEDLLAYLAAPAEPEEATVEPEIVVVEEVVLPEPPVMKNYGIYGYILHTEVGDGEVVLEYPAFIPDEDVIGFFAVENKKYGLGDLGVVYTLEGDGRAVLTYPETYSRDVVSAELDLLVEDLLAYLAAPAEPEEAAVEPEIVVVEEAVPAEPEEIVYPYGIEPIVKAEGDTDGFDLYIVHTNDVHGRIVAGEDGSMGYAKLDTLLKEARTAFPDILLLDAGDTLHGTNLANMFEGQTVLEIMDMLGYDAMVPGNHDFNYGYERLAEAAEWAEDNASFRILGANITDEDGYMLLQPYQIFDYNGFKVCVLGLSTPDTKTKSHPKNTEGIEFLHQAVIDNAQYAIDLAHEYADFVIVLGHMGVVPDGESGITSEYICENLDGIDLFIDGHSHTVMDGGEMVNGAMITSTGQYLNNVGIVEVHVDEDNNAEIENAFLLSAEEVLDPSTGSMLRYYGINEVPDDPEVDAYVAEKNEELDAILSEVVANIPMDLNGERADVRTRKTNLSKLICEAMTAESGADFTIMNGGGIRASLKAGPVTLGDINNVLPFTNTITVCRITPAGIYAALEHGYSLLPEQNGAFSQTDLSVVYSAKAPAGERIKRVYLGDELLDKTDDSTEYLVATNDFMAAGGDGYTMFGKVVTEGSMLNEVFIDYLTEVYPL